MDYKFHLKLIVFILAGIHWITPDDWTLDSLPSSIPQSLAFITVAPSSLLSGIIS